MNLPTKRGYARAYMEASIKYTVPESGEYHRGVMKNCSVGGMYFAADRPLTPGAEVKIQVLSEQRDCLLPVDLNTHKAQVAWCSALETSSGRFGIGIKFFSLPGETQ